MSCHVSLTSLEKVAGKPSQTMHRACSFCCAQHSTDCAAVQILCTQTGGYLSSLHLPVTTITYTALTSPLYLGINTSDNILQITPTSVNTILSHHVFPFRDCKVNHERCIPPGQGITSKLSSQSPNPRLRARLVLSQHL